MIDKIHKSPSTKWVKLPGSQSCIVLGCTSFAVHNQHKNYPKKAVQWWRIKLHHLWFGALTTLAVSCRHLLLCFFLIAKFHHCLIGALNEFLGLTTKIKNRFSFSVVCVKEKSQVLHCRITALLHCCTPNWQSWHFLLPKFDILHHFDTVLAWFSSMLILKQGEKKPTETDSLDERMHFVWFSEQLPYIGLWQKSRTEHLSESGYSLILFYCFCLFFG